VNINTKIREFAKLAVQVANLRVRGYDVFKAFCGWHESFLQRGYTLRLR
jgi:hypothetical protein